MLAFLLFRRTPGLGTSISLPYFLDPGPRYISSTNDSSTFDNRNGSPGRRISEERRGNSVGKQGYCKGYSDSLKHYILGTIQSFEKPI